MRTMLLEIYSFVSKNLQHNTETYVVGLATGLLPLNDTKDLAEPELYD